MSMLQQADEAWRLAERLIRREEDLRLTAYPDRGGTSAIGYGRNLTTRGISEDEAELMLRNDLADAARAVERALSARALEHMGPARRAVLMSMAHQLGAQGLLGFKRMRDALEHGAWEAAASHALDSQWAKQTPARAARVAATLRGGSGLAG